MAYRGLVAAIPVGQQGFNASRRSVTLGPMWLSYTRGWVVEDGVFQKEGGAQKLNAVSLSQSILAGINWTPNSTNIYDIVALGDGSVKRDTNGAGTFASTLTSGLNLSTDPPPCFVPGGGESAGNNNKLFMFSSGDQAQVVSGTTASMAAISSPAADWASAYPTFGILHKNRIWAGGNSNDPHRIYYSSASDHEDFPNGGTLSIFPGESEKLVAAASVRGVLILWKYPRGVYTVDTTDSSPSNWTVSRLSNSVGGLNQQCITQALNDIIFLDQFGNPHLLSLINALGDFEASNIGKQIKLDKFIRATINTDNLFRCNMVYHAQKQQVWIGMPGVGADDNTFRIIIDLSEPSIPLRYFISDRDTMVSLWMRVTNMVHRPVSGDDTGTVWLMDDDDRNKDGAAYLAYAETSDIDLSHFDPKLAAMRKSGQFLELHGEVDNDWTVTVGVYWDEDLAGFIQFSNTADSGVIGSFLLDTDTLGGGSIAITRRRIFGSGRHLKLTLKNEELDENCLIAHFLLSFVPSNEDRYT